jgi:6-phosphogluconolactonase
MTTIVVAPANQFAAIAAQRIGELITTSIATFGNCRLALSGGSTPGPVLAKVATAEIEWGKVSVYFADERAVPPDAGDSNYGMIRRVFLDLVPIPATSIHRMEAERTDLDAAARDYDRLLPLALDLLLLGVGPDGHTASLFPESPALHESTRRVIAAAPPRPPIAPQVARLTITPPVIAAARTVAVLVAGSDKAAVVAAVLGKTDGGRFPAALARDGLWILDRDAAAHLQPEDT